MSKSNDYWRKREEEALQHYISEEREYDKALKKIYGDMLSDCQTQIDSFYGKYARAEGISITEAKRRVSSLDIAAYERKAKRYVEEKDFSKTANKEMRLYNATMKINRLEMLKANLGLELISGHDKLGRFMNEILKGRTEAELTRQAGILGKSVRDNAKMANSIVNASFHNATFSQRVWANQSLLQSRLNQLLQTGLIQGKNPRVLAAELRKTFNSSVYDSERLMRTELARVQVDAQLKSFEKNGFTHYEFIANSGCCDACQGLNGKHFEVKKAMPGENTPPIHPHCRCSVAAWEDDKDYEAWLDFLDKGGTTAEWNKLNNTRKTVAKSGGSGIMRSGAISGGHDSDSEEALTHAITYYASVRAMKTDCKNIARNTNIPEKDIRAIKDFIFMKKHDLGGAEPEHFYPSYRMGESWRRLIDGREIQQHDLTLLKHEIMEKDLMSKGYSQDEAHMITNEKYNYKKEADAYYAEIDKHKKK